MDPTDSPLTLDIVSDVICPWCFIGKRRLEKALAMLGPGHAITVRWRPFELNPAMPKGGIERRAYRSAKFGSWERSQALDRHVEMAGAPDGIVFRHDLMERTPNSFDAHRLMWLAGKQGAQDKLAEILFRSYFLEGKDVGDHAILSDAAAKAGMDAGAVTTFLAGTEGAEEVSRELAAARRMDVTGVPTFVLNGQPLASGAQPPEILAGMLRRALGLPPE